jgi:putative ABC transport system permease protein
VSGAGPALLWLRAPLVLRHFPGVLVAVVSATTVLGLASASTPLFFASAANRAVAERIETVTRWRAGLTVQHGGPFFGEEAAGGERVGVWRRFAQRGAELEQATAPLDNLDVGVLSMLGQPFTMRRESGGPEMVGRLVTRTGGLAHIDPLASLREGRLALATRGSSPWKECPRRVPSRNDGPAVWIADSVARPMRVCPGDRISVSGVRRTVVTVGGVYRNLVTVFPTRFWQSLAGEFLPEGAPAFVLADHSTFRLIAGRLRDGGGIRWEFPVRGRSLTLPEATALAGGLREIIGRFGHGRYERLFPGADADSLLLGVARLSERMISATRHPINLLALAGTLLALGVTAAAGIYGVQRRRVEHDLLVTRGISPIALGAKASLEAILPALVGVGLGLGVCVWLVKMMGPSELLEAEAIGAALTNTAWALLGGVALLAAVAGTAASRGVTPPRRARRLVRVVPWDLALLVAAYLAYREVGTRADLVARIGGASQVDVLVLVFPILFIAGATGIASRGLRLLLPRLRVSGGALPSPLFLAARRLAAASGIALLLVTIAALAVGVFVYAGTLVTSGRATVDGKALIFIGSDVSVPLPPNPRIPDVPFDATVVRKVDGARVMPGLVTVDVLGVDPDTFATTAFWDDSFADRPLTDLLSAIQLGPRRSGDMALPTIAVGAQLGPESVLEAGGQSNPLEIMARARVFPGMASQRPLLVLDRAALEVPDQAGVAEVGSGGTQELWVEGPSQRIVDRLSDAGLPLATALTLDDVRNSASLLPSEWTFGFLQSLGGAAGLIALVGMVLYLQARQRARVVASSLAQRMGLSGRAHAGAIGVELAAMLVVAFILGSVLAGVAADLVYARIDPLPNVPPEPLLRVPLAALAVIPVVLAAASVVGAWRVQRSAHRANVAEVMRLAH